MRRVLSVSFRHIGSGQGPSPKIRNGPYKRGVVFFCVQHVPMFSAACGITMVCFRRILVNIAVVCTLWRQPGVYFMFQRW